MICCNPGVAVFFASDDVLDVQAEDDKGDKGVEKAVEAEATMKCVGGGQYYRCIRVCRMFVGVCEEGKRLMSLSN